MAAAYGFLRSQERRVRDRPPVITGLDPAIQPKSRICCEELDCRIKSGNDAVGMICLEK
jgi:hypothetical protein